MQYVRICKLPVLVKEGKIIVLYYLASVIFYSLIVGMEIGEKYNLDQCKHRKANELLELSENVNLSEKIVKESCSMQLCTIDTICQDVQIGEYSRKK